MRLAALPLLALAAFTGCRGPAPAPRDERATAESVERPEERKEETPPDPQVKRDQRRAAGARMKIEDEKNTVDVFKTAAPSTVFVTQKRVVADFFQGTSQEVPVGSGTGFVWDDKGHVVTNYHVVEAVAQRGGGTLSVTLFDKKSYDATIVGVEPRKDIAVLRIAAPPASLTPIQRPEPGDTIEVGQKTLAIGNPFGLDHTLTTGVVSALGRSVMGVGNVTIRDMIQTDAAINPGNSGGPLLDSTGTLIGMNTMIYSPAGQSAGIGFAVPAQAILRVVPQLIDKGKVETVGIGISLDPQGRLERQNGLSGVVVLDAQKGGPADKAGLRGVERNGRGWLLGDVIVGVDGQKVKTYDDLYNALDGKKPGDKVKVKILRDGKEEERTLALAVVE